MKNALLFFFLFIAAGCIGQPTGDYLRVTDYPSFEVAFDSLIASDKSTLYFPTGEYEVNDRIRNLSLTKDIRFVGEPGAVIYPDTSLGNMIQLYASKTDTIDLLHSIPRDSDTIYLTATADVLPGDLIHVSSSQVVEAGWGTKENDLHRIAEVVNDTTVVLSSTLNFAYNSINPVIIARPVSLYVEGLTFRLDSFARPWGGSDFFTLWYIAPTFKDCKFINSNRDSNPDGMIWVRSHDGLIEDCEFDGFRYAVLVNASRKMRFNRVHFQYCGHGYTPATWTSDSYLTDITGYRNGSTMDAHPSFDFTVDGIETIDDEGYPNCRAAGKVEIRNAHLRQAEDGPYHTYAYFGAYEPQLNPEYKYVAQEQTFLFENVTWLPTQPGSFNGLTYSDAARADFINVTTNVVGSWHRGAPIRVINSRIGELQNRGAELTLVSNTVFDASIHEPGDYIIRNSASAVSGGALFSNCTFINYNEETTQLVNWNYRGTVSVFTTCTFGPIKGIGWFHPAATSDAVRFVGCRFEKITDPLPWQLLRDR